MTFVRSPHDPRPGERGTVLVLSVIVVTLIVVLVTDASHIARIEWEAATNADHDLQLDYALKSGYQIAEAYLRQDKIDAPDVEHAYEEWAAPGGITKDLDPSEYIFSSDSSSEETPTPRIRIIIEDEDRKWPLPVLRNGNDTEQELRRDQLAVLLDEFRANTNYDLDPGTAKRLAEQIVAFVKRPPNDASFGATPRPSTKSGFPLGPADLALIPSMNPEILFDVLDDGRNSGELVIVPGLIHFITWYTDLRVNINTAPEAVLVALPRPENKSIGRDIAAARSRMTEEFDRDNPDMRAPGSVSAGTPDPRRELERERAERNTNLNPTPGAPENQSENVGYWTTVEDLQNANIATLRGRFFDDIRPLITTQSSTFSIWVEAELQGVRKVRRWIVRREAARFVPILSEPVTWPRFRPLSEEERYERDETR